MGYLSLLPFQEKSLQLLSVWPSWWLRLQLSSVFTWMSRTGPSAPSRPTTPVPTPVTARSAQRPALPLVESSPGLSTTSAVLWQLQRAQLLQQLHQQHHQQLLQHHSLYEHSKL